MNEAYTELLSALPSPPDWRWGWRLIEGLPPLAGWIARMKATVQEKEHHGEGDVWTHTCLVCEALSGLEAFRTLREEDRTPLALAALLHDIGKPVCTRMEDGRLTAPHHGREGAHIARTLLWREFGLCGALSAIRTREAVCALVRWHARPQWLMDADDPERECLSLASLGELAPAFSMASLCLLAEADVRGRIAADRDEWLFSLEMCREACAGFGCLTAPYPFRSALTQRRIFTGGNVWKEQELYDDAWGEVTVLSGLPGVGKDTWCAAHPELPAVSLDAVRRRLGVQPGDDQGRVVQAAREEALAYLRAKRPFVWNATCLTPRTRQGIIGRAEDYRARVRVVYLETDWDENLRRNEERRERVPLNVMFGMLESIEPPLRAEAQQVIWQGV